MKLKNNLQRKTSRLDFYIEDAFFYSLLIFYLEYNTILFRFCQNIHWSQIAIGSIRNLSQFEAVQIDLKAIDMYWFEMGGDLKRDISRSAQTRFLAAEFTQVENHNCTLLQKQSRDLFWMRKSRSWATEEGKVFMQPF